MVKLNWPNFSHYIKFSFPKYFV